ncbi:hypothetical protein HY212_04640 [Candidatus Pacearchaeota archaeon]|nr:hypothetical protein [Candidatus Pacearchaeota archaeon]
MALTPRIRINLTPDQTSLANALEARIDRYIQVNFDGKPSSVVRVDISDYSRGVYREAFPKMIDEITRRYRQANWNVNYIHDGRENQYVHFIELTPKKTASSRIPVSKKKIKR